MIWLALLSPVAISSAPAPVKPVPTTIAAIRSDPKKFNGQVVRLTGWVNQCQRLSCGIEERPASDPKGAGQRLSIAGDAKFDRTIVPLLPTYVEFDARVDTGCLVSPAGDTIMVCADRVPDLTVVSLRAVVSPEPPPSEE
ncbi:MAG TPA: hypothetical protein VGE68_00935 [Sphingomicrobium sp.]